MLEDLDEIIREFLVESHENLDQLDSDLVALERTPDARDLLSSVFRTIHTIKGTSGFLAFSALESLTHAGENLLVELRDGRRSMDQPTTDALLRMVDAVRAILRSIEADGTEGQVDTAPAVEQIRAVMEGRTATAQQVEAAAPVPAKTRKIVARKPVAKKIAAASSPATDTTTATLTDEPSTPTAATSPTAQEVTEVPTPRTGQPPAATPPAAATPATTPPAATAPPAAQDGRVTPDPAKATDPGPEHTLEGSGRSAADASIRVDVDLLDALMRQVGELVLARNAISRLADDMTDVDLVRASQRLSLIASELQEGVMKTRMQPIEHVWSKVPRMVRDLAAACDRKVRLSMVGGDTELDRSLLEAIKDPLTHLIRNAVDHGIEPSAQRVATGKDAQGTVLLRAHHAGGQVVVEVTDDGAGIDPDRVAAKAVERGLRTADQVAAMSTAELLALLFLPGFSTTEAVTNVSGRGVGMDVVRTKIEAIGGTVDVDSTVGTGTTWRLRIPLTLAIMPALTVVCDDQLYAIPQVSLLELVALDALTSGSIEYVRSAPVYRLRGDLLPLVDLREVFGAPARTEGGRTVIAVLQADNQRFGLVVDQVLNTEEIVVKPLASQLKAIGLYAGATLLGDGRVSLILDVQAIARRAMTGEVAEAVRSRSSAQDAATARATVQVLVAGIGGGRRVAIPLSAVTRLEKLPAGVVEHVGGREVVQYRGAITPVVRLDRTLGGFGSSAPDEELTIVVYSRGTRSVALVVADIVDIVDDDAATHSDVADAGLVGSTVLKDRVTELLDIKAAVAAADPAFFADEDDTIEAFELDTRDLVGV